MPRSARWIILASLVVMAIALHAGLCSWHWNSPPPEWSLMTSARIVGAIPDSANDGVTGLWASRGVDAGTSLVFGVVTPFALFSAALVLALFWRHQDRLRDGQCLRCGYKLDGTTKDRCPECGATRSQGLSSN